MLKIKHFHFFIYGALLFVVQQAVAEPSQVAGAADSSASTAVDPKWKVDMRYDSRNYSKGLATDRTETGFGRLAEEEQCIDGSRPLVQDNEDGSKRYICDTGFTAGSVGRLTKSENAFSAVSHGRVQVFEFQEGGSFGGGKLFFYNKSRANGIVYVKRFGG